MAVNNQDNGGQQGRDSQTHQRPRSANAQNASAAKKAGARPSAGGGPKGVGVAAGGNVVVNAPKKKSNGKRIGIIVGAAVVVVAVVVALVIGLSGGSVFDSSAQSGQAPYKTREQIQAELDKQVQEGMFNISIASLISFETADGEGVAYIENVPSNHFNMQCTITEDETGDILYKSGVIKPNQFIEKIKLDKQLEPGTHAATATFVALDPDTGNEEGQAAAKVSIIIES